ncbi:hypothetical protein N9H39_02565 [Gammaproteobacteria bacterium]|nr:hypothetical protein [Gammaproteobacteria bacterium]
MAENLLSASGILLYGREIKDLKIDFREPSKTNPNVPPRLGKNLFLQEQLKMSNPRDPESEPRFARIYGFAYEGHYYDMARPTVFLVHGEGVLAEDLPGDTMPARRYSRAPDTLDKTGVGAQMGGFSAEIMVWAYDRADFSLRLDIDSGSFEELLLEIELDGNMSHYSGARVSGGKVGGGKVGGGKVGGGKVGGRNRGDE